MYNMKITRVIALAVLLSVAALAPASIPAARALDHNPSPDLALPSLRHPGGTGRKQTGLACIRSGRADLQMERHDLGVCRASGDVVRRPQLSRESRHALPRTHLGEQQWQQSSHHTSFWLHTGYDSNPLVAATDGLDRGPRHFRLGDLHPAGKHQGRFSSHGSRNIHRRSGGGALHRGVLLLSREELIRFAHASPQMTRPAV